jgi:cytochrome oxidase Cu insertion factor (SCO1/SenC/PrrC family)
VNRRRWIARVVGMTAGGWTGLSLGEDGRWLNPAPTVPDIRLSDQDGMRHALRDLCSRPVVISFFFSECASSCPLQMALLRQAQATWHQGSQGSASDAHPLPLLLSITLDPQTDTPNALRTYGERLGAKLGLVDGWLLLTGETAEIGRVWRAFGVHPGRPQAHEPWLWVGNAPMRRWTRLGAAAGTPALRRAVDAVQI